MLRKVFGLLLVITAAAIFLVAAPAQSGSMTVEVPFDFAMGEVTLLKGTYRVQTHNQYVLQLINEKGKVWNILTVGFTGNKTAREGRLVFNRYGDQYFLTRVIWLGRNHGKELRKSALETEVARTFNESRRLAITAK